MKPKVTLPLEIGNTDGARDLGFLKAAAVYDGVRNQFTISSLHLPPDLISPPTSAFLLCSTRTHLCVVFAAQPANLHQHLFSPSRTSFQQAILLERPRVISANVGHAWDLPENTFGAAYARFMGSRNFSPDDRPPVRFMDTEELVYVAMRAREVHDFWHTLFGLPTNLIGESALKVIEFEQMLLPMCLLSVVGGTVRFNDKQRALFFQHYFPWATRAGMRSTDLISVYYERHFHEDLEDVRRRWGIIPAPVPTKPI